MARGRQNKKRPGEPTRGGAPRASTAGASTTSDHAAEHPRDERQETVAPSVTVSGACQPTPAVENSAGAGDVNNAGSANDEALAVTEPHAATRSVAQRDDGIRPDIDEGPLIAKSHNNGDIIVDRRLPAAAGGDDVGAHSAQEPTDKEATKACEDVHREAHQEAHEEAHEDAHMHVSQDPLDGGGSAHATLHAAMSDDVYALHCAAIVEDNVVKVTQLVNQMFDAAASGSADIIRTLAAALPDADRHRPHNGLTPLHVAAREGHVDAIHALVDCGARVNATAADDTNDTPACVAAESGAASSIAALKARDADLALEGTNGSPLHIAAMRGHVHLIRVLKDAGLRLSTQRATDRLSPLCLAAQFGHTDVIMELAQCGVSCRSAGIGPLVEAAAGNHVPAVHALLDLYNDPSLDVTDAYDAATANCSLDAMRVLRGRRRRAD